MVTATLRAVREEKQVFILRGTHGFCAEWNGLARKETSRRRRAGG